MIAHGPHSIYGWYNLNIIKNKFDIRASVVPTRPTLSQFRSFRKTFLNYIDSRIDGFWGCKIVYGPVGLCIFFMRQAEITALNCLHWASCTSRLRGFLAELSTLSCTHNCLTPSQLNVSPLQSLRIRQLTFLNYAEFVERKILLSNMERSLVRFLLLP